MLEAAVCYSVTSAGGRCWLWLRPLATPVVATVTPAFVCCLLGLRAPATSRAVSQHDLRTSVHVADQSLTRGALLCVYRSQTGGLYQLVRKTPVTRGSHYETNMPAQNKTHVPKRLTLIMHQQESGGRQRMLVGGGED